MPFLGTVGEIYSTRNGEFHWKVGDFLSLSDEPNSLYMSPEIKFKGHSCGVTLYPAGDSDSGGDKVRLKFMSYHSQDETSIQCSAGIETARGETVLLSSHTMPRPPIFFYFYNSQWILRSDLLRRRDELMPLGDLTVVVSFKEIGRPNNLRFKDVSVRTAVARNSSDACVEKGEDDGEHGLVEKAGYKHASVQTAVGENLSDASVQTIEDDGEQGFVEKAGVEKVLQDIGKLWTSGEDSDVVMKVRGVEFKAHRAILRIRAPLLGVMFQHDTTEKASGEVVIDDCEPAVFEELLHYVYTGAPRELTAENAAALYTVADKYLVSEVKALCLQCMKDTICVDSFCESVTLSLLHNEEELLSLAIGFLSEHMVDVMKTVEWQVFSRDHSTWANEILIRALEFGANNRESNRDPSSV